MLLKTLLAAASTVMIVGSAWAGSGTTAFAEGTLDQRIPTGIHTAVRVNNEMGSVRVQGSEDATGVTVTATRKAWANNSEAARDAVERLVFTAETVDQTLEIVSSSRVENTPSLRTEFDLTVTVPAGFTVQAQAPEGNVTISDVASVSARTTNGSVDINRTTMPVDVMTESGAVTLDRVLSADVRTLDGRVDVYRASMTVTVATRNGNVNLLDIVSATVSTQNGDVRIQGAPMPLDITTESGSVTLREVGPVAVRTTTGNVDIASSNGSAAITTRTGNVQLTRVDSGIIRTCDGSVHVEGTNGPLHIATGNGNVSAHLEGRLEGTHIMTTTGSVELSLPGDVDGTFKIGSRHGHVAVSDIPFVTRSERRSGIYGTTGNGTAPIEVLSRHGNISVTGGGSPVTRGDLKHRETPAG